MNYLNEVDGEGLPHFLWSVLFIPEYSVVLLLPYHLQNLSRKGFPQHLQYAIFESFRVPFPQRLARVPPAPIALSKNLSPPVPEIRSKRESVQ